MRAPAPQSMKIASTLDKGGLRGLGKGEPTHPGATRPSEVFSRLHLRATPQGGIFKGALTGPLRVRAVWSAGRKWYDTLRRAMESTVRS